jgi:hypothetical protein
MPIRCIILPLVFLWGIVPLLPAKFEYIPDFRFRVRIDQLDEAPQANGPKYYDPLAKEMPRIDLAEGQWSEWTESTEDMKKALNDGYPNMMMGDMKTCPFVIALTFHPTPERVKLSFEWQTSCKEGDTKGNFTATWLGPGNMLLLWQDADGKYRMGPPSEFNKRYTSKIDELKLTPENLPKKFVIADRLIGGNFDEKALEEGIRLITLLGFNTIHYDSPGAKQQLAKYGVTKTAGGVYMPPLYFDSDPNVTSPEALQSWAKKQADEIRKTGWDPKDVGFFALADEPGWYYPSVFRTKGGAGNENYLLERFREYLKSNGLQPADVGASKWEAVNFLGRGGVKDLPTKRLYYWSMRFFPDNSAEVFARSIVALEKAFSPGLPLSVNWNNFTSRSIQPGWFPNNPPEDKANPDAGMGDHDWVYFGRKRGATALWTEDWFGDAVAFNWSIYATRLRSGANAYNDHRKESDPPPITFGGYVIGCTCTENVSQRVLSLFGHGGKVMYYYVFGPEYQFPGNCWSENLGMYEHLAKALRMVGKAEDLMYPGQPWRAQVAILSPQSAQMWDRKEEKGKVATPVSDVDYMAEGINLLCALQHANIPADFIDEAGLMNPEDLKKLKVIYITAPNLPAKAVETLKQWVSDGGILVATAGAGQFDIYDEPLATLNPILGIQPAPHARIYAPDHIRVKDAINPIGKEGARFRGCGFSEILKPTTAKALAQFEKGGAAITWNPVGKGGAMVHGTLLGTAYNYHLQTDGLRNWVTWPVKQAGIQSPVAVDRLKIEAPVLVSDKGLAITLLNWSGDIPSTDFQVTVNLACFPGKKIGKVTSIELGDLQSTQEGDKAKITVPSLELADVLKIYWQ